MWGQAPPPPTQAAYGQAPPPPQAAYGQAPPPPQAAYGQPPPQPQAAYYGAPPAPAPAAMAAAPTGPSEVRTLWIGDLQYWMDENYVYGCFASTGEVRAFGSYMPCPRLCESAALWVAAIRPYRCPVYGLLIMSLLT